MANIKTVTSRAAKALAVVLCLWLVLILIIRTLQNTAINQIAELTNTRIEVHSVNSDLNGSVLLKKLVIRPDHEPKYDDAILKAQKAYARFSIPSLLLLRPRLKELRLQDFIFDAQYDLDTQSWNVAQLKIKAGRHRGGKMPLVVLEKGKLRYKQVSGGRAKIISSTPINAKFGPADFVDNAYSFSITTAGTPAGKGMSNLAGVWQKGSISIYGGISSTDVPAFEKAWSIENLRATLTYDPNNNYSLKLKVTDLLNKQGPAPRWAALAKPRFLQKLGAFASLEKFFNLYQPAGIADINLSATGNLAEFADSQIIGKIWCKDASFRYRKFPYRIEHLTGTMDFDERSVTLNNLCGRHGDVELFFNGFSGGFGPDWQYQIRVTSENMTLDNDLYNALNTRQKKFWNAFSPTGHATIDYRLSRKPATGKKRTLNLVLLDGNAAYHNFPYPLNNLKGTLLFEKDSATVSELVSRWNGRTIALNGKVTSLASDRPMWDITIGAKNIPLDSMLLNALPEKHRILLERFDTDGNIRIEDLDGRVWCSKDNLSPCYRFTLKSKQLESNNILLSFLPEKLKSFTSSLNPQGRVNVTVLLDNSDGTDIPEYKVTIDCLQNRLDPVLSPYPLKNLCGTATIAKDNIELCDMTASIDDDTGLSPGPTITVAGQISIAEDGFGPTELSISAMDFPMNEKLCEALPGNIRPFYSKVAPKGSVDLHLEKLKFFDGPNGDKCIGFAGTAKIKMCSLRTNPPTTDLNATLRINGSYENSRGLQQSCIRLSADTLRIKGKALTDLRADVSFDPERQSWLAENFVAESYAGRVAGKFELRTPGAADAGYMLQAGFHGVDLKKFLTDTTRDDIDCNNLTAGEMNGSLTVAASFGNNPERLGRCRLDISDMQIGQLSPLANLLTVLKITEPADFAFERMLVDSYINNDELLVRKFDLSGPRIAFNGSGLMDLQTEKINLTLTARGDRLATDEPSLLDSLAEALGRAVVRMDVKGHIGNPQVTTTALPVIKGTLGILGTKTHAQSP